MYLIADNLKGIPFSSPDEETFLPLRNSSFTYTRGGWKAVVDPSVPDGKYYEVTHNASKQETCVDTYIKVQNTKYSLEGDKQCLRRP